MQLMRIGAAGAEKPVASVDDDSYVYSSDAVGDFDEGLFGSGGLDRIRALVADRAAARTVSRFAGEWIGAPIARAHQSLPPGVGMGLTPPVWPQPGDVMELGIQGLGSQRQNVLAPR